MRLESQKRKQRVRQHEIHEIIFFPLVSLQEHEMKEEKGTGAEAESQSQLVAKEDNKGKVIRFQLGH